MNVHSRLQRAAFDGKLHIVKMVFPLCSEPTQQDVLFHCVITPSCHHIAKWLISQGVTLDAWTLKRSEQTRQFYEKLTREVKVETI
jgi:hypothetical protein